MDEIFWIHDMDPESYSLSEKATNEIAQSLMTPSTTFGSSDECDPSEPYAFVRLFGLSFANPTIETNSSLVSFIIQLLCDQHEFIAAASIQVIIIWVLTYNVIIPRPVVFKLVAAIFDENRPIVLKDLYRALLRVIGSQCQIVSSLVSLEPTLNYDQQMESEICQAKWTFPQFPESLKKLPEVRLVAYVEAMKVLGCLLNCFGLNGTSPRTVGPS